MKRFTKYLLCVIALLGLSISHGQNVDDKAIRGLYLQANKDYAWSRNEEALDSYLQLISYDYQNSTALDQDEKDAVVTALSWIYTELGDYEKAMPYIRENLTTLENKNEIKGFGYIFSQANLAEATYHLGDQIKAEILFEQILNKASKHLKSYYYRIVIQKIIEFYSSINNYFKALPLQQEQLRLLEIQFGKDHKEYQKYLSIYGVNNINAGNQKDAQKIFIEVLELIKAREGSNTEDYAMNLHNLSTVKSNIGELYDAILLNYQALDIYRNISDQDSENYLNVLNSIGILYYKLGEFDRAANHFIESYQKGVKILGDLHSSNFTPAFNLASIYYGINNYIESNKYLKIAAAIEVYNRSSEENTDYAAILSLKVKLLLDEESYSAAETLATKQRDIIGKLTGKMSSSYASSTTNLAHIYYETNRKKQAMQLFEEAFEILEFNEGNQNENYAVLANIIFTKYLLLGNTKKAISYAELSNSSRLKLLQEIFQFRSEYEKSLYLESFITETEQYESLLHSLDEYSTRVSTLNINNQLIKKSLLLNSSRQVIQNLSQLNNSKMDLQISNYRKVKANLNKAIINKNQKLIDSLFPITERLQVDLIRANAGNNDVENLTDKKWQEIQKNLKNDEIAIEFSSYQYMNKNKWTDTVYYSAHIIAPHLEIPQSLHLFSEEDLKSIISKQNPNKLYASRGGILKSNNKNSSLSTALYDLILKPLETYIESYSKIYYAASGLLSQIPLEALYLSQNRNKPKQLFQMSTTYKLCDSLVEPKNNSLLFIGGVDYGVVSKNTLSKEKNDIIPTYTSERSSKVQRDTWNYLPGTLQEVNSLKNLFKTKKVTVLSEKNATEEAFKELSGNSPDLIHIATHGFFFESREESDNENMSIYKSSNNPLLRSGLIFSGGNSYWNNGLNNEDQEDGILTALEIATLDLSNTDMVVLSACETGLGDIDGSEGVYGLQRAFKMAGVDIIVMSLWEVPDKETAEFMELFYGLWINNGNVRNAFKSAQQEMSKRYNDEPEKWAAFVMVE